MIDQKGKLFGKVNVIDFFVVLLIVVLGVGVVYKVATGGQGGALENGREIHYVVQAKDILPEVTQTLQEGDQLFIGDDTVQAWVEKIEDQPAKYFASTADGKLVEQESPTNKDALITIRAVVADNDKFPKLGVQVILVGWDFTIKTKTAYVKGVVVDIKE